MNIYSLQYLKARNEAKYERIERTVLAHNFRDAATISATVFDSPDDISLYELREIRLRYKNAIAVTAE